MPGVREDVKRIRERNEIIFPEYEPSEPLYLKLIYFRLPTVAIPIGMFVEPYAEASVRGFIRNIRNMYNSLTNIFYRI